MLIAGIVELSTGRMQYSWAGEPNAIRLSTTAGEIALAARPPLGATTDANFAEQSLELAVGETLLLTGDAIGERSALAKERDSAQSPADLLETLADLDSPTAPAKHDRALLAIKRT